MLSDRKKRFASLSSRFPHVKVSDLVSAYRIPVEIMPRAKRVWHLLVQEGETV